MLTSTQAIQQALCLGSPPPMVVGWPANSKSVSYVCGDEICLNSHMPAGQNTYQSLPAGNKTCATAIGTGPTGYLMSNSSIRYKNTLLGQTIALSLNIRLYPNLGNLQITTSTFTTWAATACSGGNAIPGTNLNFSIPQSVINCLGSAHKVSDLLVLANKKLGGVNTCSSASLGDITAALDAVNNGFDRCRVVASGNIRLQEMELTYDGTTNMVVYPNPSNGETTIDFVPSSDSRATLDVFSMNGALAASLYNNTVSEGSGYSVKFNTASFTPGIYFIRLTVGDESAIGKLVILKRE